MIELENLQKVIDQTTVIDIPALKVEAGEISALVGPTKSGKGTLLDILIGQSRPTAGRVRLNQIDPAEGKDQLSRTIGVLFFEDSHYESRSPKANLVFHCRLRGLPTSRAEATLTKVGLADHANAKLGKISSGLARRLAFGRAILHEPTILLLVDPFARCDEASITLLSALIREQANDGASILILAEDVTNLTSLCDSIHTLNKGQIVKTITLDDGGVATSGPLHWRIRGNLLGSCATCHRFFAILSSIRSNVRASSRWIYPFLEDGPIKLSLILPTRKFNPLIEPSLFVAIKTTSLPICRSSPRAIFSGTIISPGLINCAGSEAPGFAYLGRSEQVWLSVSG